MVKFFGFGRRTGGRENNGGKEAGLEGVESSVESPSGTDSPICRRT